MKRPIKVSLQLTPKLLHRLLYFAIQEPEARRWQMAKLMEQIIKEIAMSGVKYQRKKRRCK